APISDKDFQITVKRVEGGRVSNYLCDKVGVGDVLKVTPPAGVFFKNHPEKSPQHFFLFAAGSGVTPIFSILKHVLMSHPENKVSFMFANRSQQRIIYKKALDEWGQKYQDRLSITHVLSQPEAPWEGPSGRTTEVLIKNFVEIQKS